MTLTGYLVFALVVMTTIAAGEAYVLIARIQLMRNDLDLLLAAARQLLGAVPSKSAPRTTAADDVQPRRWWQRLPTPAGESEPEPFASDEPVPAPPDDVDLRLARFSYTPGHRQFETETDDSDGDGDG